MSKSGRKNIATYEHPDQERVNNPPVGLVTPDTDRDSGDKPYTHDPHLDPELSWSGKAEHTSFEVPTVSLHVHERIDPRTIIEAVRKMSEPEEQGSLFAAPEENPPLRHAIEFYRHRLPMAGAKDSWAKLAKSLKAEIDATRMAAYRGAVSLPFEPGEHGRAAVKIVDDRGVESLRIMELS